MFFIRTGVDKARLLFDELGGNRCAVLVDGLVAVLDGATSSSFGEISSYEEETVGANTKAVFLGIKISSCLRVTRGGVCMTPILELPGAWNETYPESSILYEVSSEDCRCITPRLGVFLDFLALLFP